MYAEIKKHIEHRISQTPRFDIDRVAAGKMDSERPISLIAAHVASELEPHIKEMNDAGIPEATAQIDDTIRKFGGLGTALQLEKHFTDKIITDSHFLRKKLNIKVRNGSKVLAPPYDVDWSEGNGFGAFARFDGDVIVVPKSNGFSAAGIGFYLTTNEPALVSITPQGTYSWNWVAFADFPYAQSRGGMGITIYVDAHPEPIMSRQQVLWSVSGMTAFSGQKGSGQIADAASPGLGFGSIPLAPALVNMYPGSQYLVWIWCWQTTRIQENSAFIAFMNFSMPLVTIDAGPQIFVH